MTSEKPIYKKPFEPIDNYKESKTQKSNWNWMGGSEAALEFLFLCGKSYNSPYGTLISRFPPKNGLGGGWVSGSSPIQILFEFLECF